MATPGKASRARKSTKKAASSPEDVRAAAHPGFKMEDDGRIVWPMGGKTYVLEPITVEAYMDLDWIRQGGGAVVQRTLALANEMPNGSDEERTARTAALKDGYEARNEWLLGYYTKIFEYAEREQRPFPRQDAPAWLMRAGLMSSFAEHLQGPPPPGVG